MATRVSRVLPLMRISRFNVLNLCSRHRTRVELLSRRRLGAKFVNVKQWYVFWSEAKQGLHHFRGLGRCLATRCNLDDERVVRYSGQLMRQGFEIDRPNALFAPPLDDDGLGGIVLRDCLFELANGEDE